MVRDDGSNGFRSSLNVGKNSHHSLGCFRRRNELEDDVGEHTQSSFGSNHEAGEVITGNTLNSAGTGFNQVTVYIIEIHAHDVVFGNTVFESTESACVLSNVTTDGGNCLGTRIRGIEKSFRGNLCCELCSYNTGFYYCVEVFFVDFEDFVQTVGQYNNTAGWGMVPPEGWFQRRERSWAGRAHYKALLRDRAVRWW